MQRRLGLPQPSWLSRSLLQGVQRPGLRNRVPLLHGSKHRIRKVLLQPDYGMFRKGRFDFIRWVTRLTITVSYRARSLTALVRSVVPLPPSVLSTAAAGLASLSMATPRLTTLASIARQMPTSAAIVMTQVPDMLGASMMSIRCVSNPFDLVVRLF